MKLIGVLGFVVISFITYNREERINSYFSNHKTIDRVIPFFVCFIISFLFSINLCLSPFNDLEPYIDSSVFLYIGKSMHNGMIPYKDLFDHKGIVLYFIEYLGYFVGLGNKIGVWIIELINIYVTTLLFYHIARLFSSSKIVCYLSTYLVIALSTLSFFEGGNLVEEYALPWISLSLYIVIKFFITKTYKAWHIITLGVGFTIVLFLRVNMVGLWAPLILAVIVYLVKNKRITEILKCALLFVAGCLCVFVPIMVYLLSTNSLKDMIDYYIVFNLSYTGAYSRRGIISFVFNCISTAGISIFFIVYALCVRYKNKIIWLNLITLFFAYISAAISGRSFLHYGIILIPFFIIPATLTILPFMEKTKSISIFIKKRSVIVSVIIMCLLCVSLHPATLVKNNLSATHNQDSLQDYLLTNTNENDDVLILGNSVLTYINSNRYTKNKFFYQEPPIDVSDKLYEEFITELGSKPSDYIINLKSEVSIYESENNNNNGNDNETYSNHQKVIDYLNDECAKGTYQLEKHNDFQVYVRKEDTI